MGSPPDARSGVPNSVSVSDSAHRFGLLLASGTHRDSSMNYRPSALVSAWIRHGSGG
jgi:hypothetical protein